MFLSDLRYALRMLTKSPGFTVVAVLSLALGIGANTAIFSLLDQVMLRLLPVSHPEQLVILRSPGERHGHTWSDVDEGAQSFSFPMYKALREGNDVFSGLIGCYPTEASVSYRNETEHVDASLVSGNFFDVLGVEPALGRMFSLDDDRVQGGHPVVVLSYAYWQRRFGGDPSILNQAVLINAQPMTVVGVVRRGFTGAQAGQTPEVFLPLMMKPVVTPGWNALDDWNDYWLPVLGRLKPGMTIPRAQAGLQGLYHGLLEQQASASHWSSASARAQFVGRKLLLKPGGRGRDVLDHDAGTPLVALFVMVALVLLMVCTNLANLLLARGVARQRELAVRLALGANRGRLISQLLTESLVCALGGGLIGLPVAAWTLKTLVDRIVAGAGIQGLSPRLDPRVLIFSLALTVLAAVIFGLVPAFRATRTDVNSTLKNQSGASVAPAQVRFRKVMVTAQVVFTVLLLVGAGLFTRTLWNLRHVDLGMRPDHLISFDVAPALNGYSPEQTRALCDRLRGALAALPGVVSASGAEIAALTNSDSNSNITVPGAPPLSDEQKHVRTDSVAPAYFATLGIPLITGRDFTNSDGPQAPKVAIVNQAWVRRFFPNGDALGRRFAFGGGDVTPITEIVGVVQDAKNSQIREDYLPYVYLPYDQDPKLTQLTLYVRSAQDPIALGPELRKTVQRLDPNLPTPKLTTMESVINDNLFAERLVAQLSLGFGLLAAALAAIGIYGVLAYTVVQRTREIGIRVALGARPGEVQRLVYREVGPILAAGIAAGLPAAYALGRLVESLLYGIKASDLPVYVTVLILVTAAAGLATFIPASRATKVDPMVALRYE
jgi:putative ABC transport system permease protein